MHALLAKKKMDVDMESLSPDEQRLLRLYGTRGKLAPFKHINERKYFDSGDYALSKAGKAELPVGSEHPNPERIQHLAPSPAMGLGVASSGMGMASNVQLKPILTNSPTANTVGGPAAAAGQTVLGPDGQVAGSPVKAASFLNRETSADDLEEADPAQQEGTPQHASGTEGEKAPTGEDNIPIQQ